ncbi:UPF0691 protein C9orf116 homolog isoform X3 [Suricata suricatta]|uniref:UPF0691 protein C9orf116 homolog isoform X3 n=1 Tax=Suricata suricatta TaxID=37032 RepID=UPI0011559874|nr:UPF0691 protein C9orf116 homolog isoform X3 [Suricata suricatta]
MAQRNSLECTEAAEPPAPEPPGPAPPQRTSDYYRIDGDLPVRFNNPAWFRGYGTKEAVSMYRTSNQTYGSRAPTVHEMPLTRAVPPAPLRWWGAGTRSLSQLCRGFAYTVKADSHGCRGCLSLQKRNLTFRETQVCV